MATANVTHGLRGPGTIVKKIGAWFIVMAVVFILLGIFAIVEPGVAGLAITFLVGLLLILGGVTHLIASLITLLLGGLIWFHWPSSSVWAIGTLVGVNLLMTGISRLMFGLAARKLTSAVA